MLFKVLLTYINSVDFGIHCKIKVQKIVQLLIFNFNSFFLYRMNDESN